MNINWKIRFKNPVFIAQLFMAIILPVLAYTGLTVQDMTSWSLLGRVLLDAVLNPYVLGLVIVNVWQTVNDPTTTGISDSERAMSYSEPNSIK